MAGSNGTALGSKIAREHPAAGRDNTLDVAVLDQLRGLERRVGRSILPGLFEVLREHVPSGCADLRRAIATSDIKTLRRVSHNLKSSSRSLGLLRLSAACAELELRMASGPVAGAETLVAAIETEFELAASELKRFLVSDRPIR